MATVEGSTRTRPLVPESRIAFPGSWELYEAIGKAIGDHASLRLAFDGKRIELMSPSEDHGEISFVFDRFILAVAGVLGIPCRGIGPTTHKKPPDRGVEPDNSYFLSPEKIDLLRAKRRTKRRDPSAPPVAVPDLAVEIDLSRSALDRPSIYAALRVPEVWRYNGERVVIERLTPEGTFVAVEEGGWLGVRPDEVARFLDEDYADDNQFIERIKAWAREALVPRRNR
jgi:Uma2 family endonuclease